MASHQDAAGRRTSPPLRNVLSAVFQREDGGSRVAQAPSSWADQSGDRKGTDQELEPQVYTCEISGCSEGSAVPYMPRNYSEDKDNHAVFALVL